VTGAPESGHRAVPHTADVRIEAWSPTREGCIAEAVRGLVEGFVDTSGVRATGTYECRLAGERAEDLLVAVLDEVVYRLDTAAEVPVEADVRATDEGVLVRFATVGVDAVELVGAVPKAVALHELSMAHGPRGWTCAVTVDV